MVATLYMVLGSMGGGTSAVAGVLHKLGVSMGSDLLHLPPGSAKDRCAYEDREFGRILNDAWTGMHPARPPVEWFQWQQSHDDVRQIIRDYLARRVVSHGFNFGLKHARLPGVWKMVKDIWPVSKTIRVLRDESAMRATMLRRQPWQRGDGVETYIRWIRESLAGEFDLTVSYEELIAKPGAVVSQLAEFCGVPVTQEAIDHVVTEDA